MSRSHSAMSVRIQLSLFVPPGAGVVSLTFLKNLPPPHTMALRPETIKAILNNWNAPKYDGSQDVRQWLKEIERLSQIYGIPPAQMTEMAVRCTVGEVNTVLTAMLGTRVGEAGVWAWADFRECVIQIEGEAATVNHLSHEFGLC